MDAIPAKSKKQRRREGKLDRISSLPKRIISIILSFLPPKAAVQTSVLSRKWKRMWTTVVPAITPPGRWDDPPAFLLLRVLSFTDLRTSVPRFRAVCHSWMSSLHVSEIVKVPPLRTPLSPRFRPSCSLACMPNVPSEFSIPTFDDNYNCPSIHLDRFYLLTPPLDNDAQAPWLVRAREFEPNKGRLVRFWVNNGESLFLTTPKVTAHINLLDYEILRAFHFMVC